MADLKDRYLMLSHLSKIVSDILAHIPNGGGDGNVDLTDVNSRIEEINQQLDTKITITDLKRHLAPAEEAMRVLDQRIEDTEKLTGELEDRIKNNYQEYADFINFFSGEFDPLQRSEFGTFYKDEFQPLNGLVQNILENLNRANPRWEQMDSNIEKLLDGKDERSKQIDAYIEELQGSVHRLQQDLNTTIGKVGDLKTLVEEIQGAHERDMRTVSNEFAKIYAEIEKLKG